MRIDDMETPWWAHSIIICGNEGEGGDDSGSGDGGAGDGAGDSGGSSGDDDADEDGGDDEDDDLPDDKDVEGLKSALKKERANAKAGKQTAKELKAAQAELQAIKDKDKSESEKATAAQQKAEAKVEKLAQGYKKSAVDSAIEKLAREMKFKDTSDAISLVDRSGIEVEQDDDDPSDVTIDAKSLKAAVKALADKKKHLIGEEGSGDPSGSKFGGGNKSKKELSEEDMKKKYPSLA